ASSLPAVSSTRLGVWWRLRLPSERSRARSWWEILAMAPLTRLIRPESFSASSPTLRTMFSLIRACGIWCSEVAAPRGIQALFISRREATTNLIFLLAGAQPVYSRVLFLRLRSGRQTFLSVFRRKVPPSRKVARPISRSARHRLEDSADRSPSAVQQQRV